MTGEWYFRREEGECYFCGDFTSILCDGCSEFVCDFCYQIVSEDLEPEHFPEEHIREED